MNSNSNQSYSSTPAEQLAGVILPNGWKVEKFFPHSKTATGGYFSSSYIVKSNIGRTAFLKAMDLQKALMSPDPARVLEKMTYAYNFERDLLERCNNRKLSRVVKILESGNINVGNGNPGDVVLYLIFELAEGDIRKFIDVNKKFDTAWTLRTLHQVTLALRQLHSIGIVHQDLKPSNVLTFDNRSSSKVADLGRASCRGLESPHDDAKIAGDLTYAPPELLYGQVSSDWAKRRLACDMYLLGSLVVFFLTGVSFTHMLFAQLDARYHYKIWDGKYFDVLPYIRHEFSRLIRVLRDNTRIDYSEDVVQVVQQLCDPDPSQRGHPKSKQSVNQYSLERYVSIFNRLARRAELSLTGHLPLKRN